MTIISHLLIYILGLVTAFIISIWVHRQHKKAWQLEYRRLMGGIEIARRDLRIVLLDATHRKVNLNAIYIVLDRIWWGQNHTETEVK